MSLISAVSNLLDSTFNNSLDPSLHVSIYVMVVQNVCRLKGTVS
jgi:hypothetical protein